MLILHDDAYYESRKPQPDLGPFKNFKRSVWNPEKKSFFDRTCEGWAQIGLFYIIFFGVIFALFTFKMWITLQYIYFMDKPYVFVSRNVETLFDGSSRMPLLARSFNDGPGLSFKPNVLTPMTSPIIWLSNTNSKAQPMKYVKALNEFFESQEEVIYLVESSIQVAGMEEREESQPAASPVEETNESLPGCSGATNRPTKKVNKNPDTEKTAWSSGPSKRLLDLYAQNLNEIGPLKKFRLKKNMWQYIASTIKSELEFNCTDEQCANRYKTLIRDTTRIRKNNGTSGNVRVDDEFEEQISKIKAIDDSVEPEIIMGIGQSMRFPKKLKIENEKKENRRKPKSMIDVLREVHMEKEINKNKRHEEKLELIRSLLAKKH